MYLLEHDAKHLALQYNIPVPAGCLFGEELPPGPWVVKGQASVGGRGKAGAIRKADSIAAVRREADAIRALTVRGQPIRAVRIEQDVGPAAEAYIAFLLEPAVGGVRVLMTTEGGIDVESAAGMRSEVARLDALEPVVRRLGQGLPPALTEAGLRMAAMFRGSEAILLEVNPLFLRADGSWIAGDMKLITDDNALFRQPALRAILEQRPEVYPEVTLKQQHGFDYVVVDPDGDIGMLTTGAGLSMMVIDELQALGLRPYNFLDVRTGGLRGDPARLVTVLRWIAKGPRVRVLLVNIFAGITDLGEFADLLLQARAAVPELSVPVVVRLVGTSFTDAERLLNAAGVAVTSDFNEALARL